MRLFGTLIVDRYRGGDANEESQKRGEEIKQEAFHGEHYTESPAQENVAIPSERAASRPALLSLF